MHLRHEMAGRYGRYYSYPGMLFTYSQRVLASATKGDFDALYARGRKLRAAFGSDVAQAWESAEISRVQGARPGLGIAGG